MKIKIQQFLGSNHSWSIVGQNIARALVKQGHELHLISTNGYDLFPKDLEKFVVESPDNIYDMQLSYTAMRNFGIYLANGVKNRFGIWNYETTVVPTGFVRHHQYCDKMLPSSQFASDIFIENGVPKEKVITVPHGINVDEYSSNEVYNLKTTKSKKILANIAQPHIRKNLEGLFESFGKAFNKNDDVCFVVKVNAKKIEENKPLKFIKSPRAAKKINSKKEQEISKNKVQNFDVDFWSIYNSFCKKYPNHAEVEIISDFLPTMTPLYNAVDIVYTMTRAECFYLPGLEGLVTDNLVIAPNWGGQLEYLNEGNSLLISGKEVRAPKDMQYWTTSPYAAMFEPDLDDGAAKLQLAVNDYDNIISKFRPGMVEQVTRLTWDNVAKQIIDLCE
jgi:glycosyltransferase involved in cell wall biosynthesis